MLDALQELQDAVGNGHVHPVVAKAILAVAEHLALAELLASPEPKPAQGGE